MSQYYKMSLITPLLHLCFARLSFSLPTLPLGMHIYRLCGILSLEQMLTLMIQLKHIYSLIIVHIYNSSYTANYLSVFSEIRALFQRSNMFILALKSTAEMTGRLLISQSTKN